MKLFLSLFFSLFIFSEVLSFTVCVVVTKHFLCSNRVKRNCAKANKVYLLI